MRPVPTIRHQPAEFLPFPVHFLLATVRMVVKGLLEEFLLGRLTRHCSTWERERELAIYRLSPRLDNRLSVAINSCRSKRNRLDSSMLGDYVIITAEWILRRPSSKSRSHDFLLLKNGKIPARRSTTENVRAKESSYPSPLLSYYIGYCYVSCYTEGRKNWWMATRGSSRSR